MPASLDDIWDAPADAAPPRAAAAPGSDDGLPPTSRRRATQPLFLDSDSDGEAGPSSRPRARSKAASAPDIDHLFDGLGDDDDDGLPKTPARERASSPFTPHAVLPSSSPPRDGWKDSGDGDKDKAGVSAGADKKRRLPKLDDARLLGPDGFPALLKQTRGFVPKGKGHEQSDLNRLMSVYQFWAHKMYPKTQFRDTVRTVEKLCHSKRMHVALSVWRDEGKAPVGDGDPGAGSDNDDAAPPRDGPVASSRDASPTPVRLPSRGPPTSGSEPEDEWDMDAAIREEEELERARAQAAPRRTAAADSEMDDESFWADLAQIRGAESGPAPRTKAPAPVSEDELWAEMDEAMDMDMDMDAPVLFGKSAPPPAAVPPPVEEDWDPDELYA